MGWVLFGDFLRKRDWNAFVGYIYTPYKPGHGGHGVSVV